jgi:hypothetical protein
MAPRTLKLVVVFTSDYVPEPSAERSATLRLLIATGRFEVLPDRGALVAPRANEPLPRQRRFPAGDLLPYCNSTAVMKPHWMNATLRAHFETIVSVDGSQNAEA